MESDCLSFCDIPHSTRLFLDYLFDFDRVQQFFPRPPLAREWVSGEAALLHYDAARRQRVAGILERQNRAWGASQETLDSIARFRSGASVIVTGQQVALFGGPLFAIYKALTAVKLATEVTHSGSDCVPVFWLATEDHDLEEVNHATILAADGTLVPFVTSAKAGEHAPMSAVTLGPDINSLADQAARLLGDCEASDFLRQAYRPDETLGGAFAKLFSRLFSHSGVVLIDASDPELHATAESVYRAAIVAAADLDDALLDRNKALEAGGYHTQVKVTPSSTLLFGMKDGARVPVHRANSDFTLGEERIAAPDLLRCISAEPHRFSANVLLRPVVQDYLLPTLAYVGGPAEVAYFAQAAVVYEELLGHITPILPRFSATLVEPRIKRLLDRYRLALPDAFHGAERLREILAERSLPADVNSSFDAAAASLEATLAAIRTSFTRLDPTLVEAAQRAGSKMRYQLARLRARAARAELRHSQEQARHADTILASLYPNRTLQEREVAGVSFLARYGTQLLLKLYDSVPTSCPDHQIVYL